MQNSIWQLLELEKKQSNKSFFLFSFSFKLYNYPSQLCILQGNYVALLIIISEKKNMYNEIIIVLHYVIKI